MKQSKTFLLLGVIVAVLILGIAYAAIQDVTLSVAGNVTASPDQGNFKVGFTGTYSLEGLTVLTANYAVSSDPNLGGTVPEGTYASDFVFDVEGLDGVGDKGTITLPISNGSTDISATLAATASVDNTTYFKITPTLDKTVEQSGTNSYELAAGGNTKLILEIECIKTPLDTVTGHCTARVTATPNN